MKRSQRTAILIASLAMHAALFAALLSVRPEPTPAEAPTMDIQLVPPPIRPKPPPKAAAPTLRPLRSAEPEPPARPQPPPPKSRPPLTDQELVAGPRLTARQLRDAPVGRTEDWSRPPRPKAKCKPPEGYPGPPLPCPGEALRDADAPFDVDKDAPNSDLAREGRHNRAMRKYLELPGAAGYPGIGCAIFHRC